MAGDSRASANAAAVLRAVLEHGPVARSGIPPVCGLSPAAVSRQTTGLLRSGLLRELPGPGGGLGRPLVPLDLNTGALSGPVTAALHIGVPASTFGLVDLRGQVLARRALPHHGLDPATLPQAIARQLRAFLDEYDTGRPLLGLGAALGGWVRPDEGTVVRHEALGWRDRPLAAELSDALGLPVRLDNHARAVAAAEILFGHPDARRSLVHLFVGNVVDAAFGIEGTVHQGPGAAAGDVAHLPVPGSRTPCPCGRTGCLQATASDTALGAEAVRLGIVPEPSVSLLVDAAATGDPRADRLLRERARNVGRAAALLLDVFNPAVLVIAELSSLLHEGYLEEIREAAAATKNAAPAPPAPRIVTPHAGPAVLPCAAATVLLDPLFRDPARLT
ncbi:MULTISPECIES: ROK family protein [Streptomyces]|uniref:ROK family protein n=1 Tax=Streptomyces TaxID=1883 RepID=UPI000566D249|nr:MULTISPECIES: ROK family protein [Streptomyces]AKL70307.1 NagC-related protein [Streptomyces sp. Mg1]RPK36761.1 N-acetylglucosamine repressor [Streptomyces sp. ADI91-18]WBY24256.1 ROK family protein [Streptomyces goshikiensis]WSS03352.1 ROK family protein [Streptomyces goshikiensis]